MNSLENASCKTGIVMNDVEQFSSRLSQKHGLVNDLLTDTTTFTNIQETILQLKASATAVAGIVNDLQSVGKSLNNTGTVGLLLKDEDMTNQVRATITNLRNSSQKLDEDLEALQHNFLLRGFFKKKAAGNLK